MKMSIIKKFRSIYLPSGEYNLLYGNYAKWSFISNVVLSMESAMATHSMLHAVSADFEPIKTYNYIAKDIVGQIGGLGYMAKMGKKIDKNPIKFLSYSNIMQQTALWSLCITPILDNYFLYIAGISSILLNISFTGFGALNAKCIQQLSRKDVDGNVGDNNVGEIYAKIAALNTFGSSIGLLFGIGIVTFFPNHETRMFFLPVLSFIRIYSFGKAIKGLI